MELLKTHKESFRKRIWSVDSNSHRGLVVTCGADFKLTLFNTQLDQKLCVKDLAEKHQKRSLRTVKISPCGNYVAVAGFDSTVSLWKIIDGNSLEYWQTLEGHENEVKSVAWSPNGQYLATCSRDKNVWIWELYDEVEFDCAAIMSGHSQDVKSVTFAINQHNVLASSSYDGTVRVWEEDGEDSGEWVETATIDVADDGTVWSVIFLDELNDVFNKEFRLVLACCDSLGLVTIYGQPLDGMSADWEKITSLKLKSSFQPDLVLNSMHGDVRALYVAANDNSVRQLCYNQNKTLTELTSKNHAHEDDVNDLYHDAEKSLLYTVSDDRTLKVWRTT